MKYPIKTNRLKYTLDRDSFCSKFDVFKVKTSEKYFKSGAYILDTPLMNDKVKAISFTKGNIFYVLLLHDDQNRRILKDVLQSSKESDSISFSEENIVTISDDVLLQLLINGLGSVDSRFLRFNNLTGHLYCFHPKWIQHGKRADKDIIKKIPTLEVSVNSGLQLDLKVRTFTSSLLKNSIEFKKKKYEDYPKYVLSAHNTLRRRLSKDERDCYILRQTNGDKTEIPFLDFASLDSFEQSKMGVLEDIRNSFNRAYGEFASLDFCSVDDYVGIDFKAKTKKENLSNIIQYLENKTIRIIDQVLNDYSKTFCEEVKAIIKKRYGKDSQIGKRVKQDSLNICLIHNAAYYFGKDDPHSITHGEAVIQHITFEDFLGNSEFAVSTVINELLIKEDLKERSISLYNWSSLGLDGDIIFGVISKEDDINHYYFMTISKDGFFSISETESDLFDSSPFSDCIHLLEDSSDSIGVVKDWEGNLLSIHDTGWTTIPEISKIHEELKNGNNKLRSAKARDEFLSSSLDVKSFNIGGDLYYFVGEIGEGMRPKVVHAANIRKIEASNGSAVAFEKLLPLMSVSFVRNGQLTIVPFPFKYLREYINGVKTRGNAV